MLIIFKEPFKTERYDVLAVNLESYDEIIVLKANNQFRLSMVKYYDAHFSNQSYLNHTMGIFESHKDCLEMLEKLAEALESGKKVFDLRATTPDAEPEKKKRLFGVH